jgi:hypothetical protein
MRRYLLALTLMLGIAAPATAAVEPFPPGFDAKSIATNGTSLYVRVGGQGPAVLLCTDSAIPAICGRHWRPCS